MLFDEQTVASIDLETKLEDQGHRVLAIASHVPQAMARLDHASDRIDGVFVAPELVGESVRPVIGRLMRMGVPYVLLSDMDEPEARRLGFRGPRLPRLAPPSALASALRELGRVAPGTARRLSSGPVGRDGARPDRAWDALAEFS